MEPHYHLAHFPDPASLARSVAGAWLAELAVRSSPSGSNIENQKTTIRVAGASAIPPGFSAPYCVAVSGGRIAVVFFQAVADLARRQPAAFHGVHFFWADERCVAPEHPESNFAVAAEHFFVPLDIPTGQIHRIAGERPGAAAQEAVQTLRQWAPQNAQGQPVLDLIFLGMGEDGHIASLFLGEGKTEEAGPAVYRMVTAPKPPPQRITLDYPVLAAARQVWVLASGPNKEAALRESLSPAGRTPLAKLLRLRPGTRIFTDIN